MQRQYRVNIAGPTTFTVLLNSIQMGFNTLAIQKRSSDVWNVLLKQNLLGLKLFFPQLRSV
nr:DNA recombination protein RmuC [Lacrimispora sp.]